MTRKHAETPRRFIYRKPLWNGQPSSFHNWAPISRKRNLVISLTTRIRRNYSPEVIDNELSLLKKILIENEYLPTLTYKNIKLIELKAQITSVEKNSI